MVDNATSKIGNFAEICKAKRIIFIGNFGEILKAKRIIFSRG